MFFFKIKIKKYFEIKKKIKKKKKVALRQNGAKEVAGATSNGRYGGGWNHPHRPWGWFRPPQIVGLSRATQTG